MSKKNASKITAPRVTLTPHNDYNDLVIPPDFAELGRPLPPPANLETFNPEPLTAEAIAVAVVDELERRGLTLRKDSPNE